MTVPLPEIWRPMVGVFTPHGRTARGPFLVFMAASLPVLLLLLFALWPPGCLPPEPATEARLAGSWLGRTLSWAASACVPPAEAGGIGFWGWVLLLWVWLARLTLGVRRLHDVGRGGLGWVMACLSFVVVPGLWGQLALFLVLTPEGSDVATLARVLDWMLVGLVVWFGLASVIWLRGWVRMLGDGTEGWNAFGGGPGGAEEGAASVPSADPWGREV